MTSKAERRRNKRQARQGPSAPRVIGANDNIQTANDNEAVVPVCSREPGVKETPNQRIFRQMLRRAIDEAPKAEPRYDPARLTPDQEKRARRANDRMKSDDPRKVTAARDEMLKIAAEVAKRVDAYRRANENAETEAVAEARGDRVARGDDGTITLTRDGLVTLSAFRRRKDGFPIPPLLTRIQHAAGLRYRHDYEMADPEKKLTPPDPERISSHGGGGEGWAEKQMEIQRRIWTIHLMIAGIEVREGERSAMPALPERHPARRAIHVLNEVAGKGTSLWNLSRSGSVRFRNAEALKVALDCCAIVYGLD